MVNKAKKYKGDEEKAVCIHSKNGIELYMYNLHNSLNNNKPKDKFDAADKSKLKSTLNDMVLWSDVPQEASKEEFKAIAKSIT